LGLKGSVNGFALVTRSPQSHRCGESTRGDSSVGKAISIAALNFSQTATRSFRRGRKGKLEVGRYSRGGLPSASVVVTKAPGSPHLFLRL
jgi:hypothetical protein